MVPERARDGLILANAAPRLLSHTLVMAPGGTDAAFQHGYFRNIENWIVIQRVILCRCRFLLPCLVPYITQNYFQPSPGEQFELQQPCCLSAGTDM